MTCCDKMDDYTAVGIAEGFIPCQDDELLRKAWQHLIDTGLAWSLQGWFGRRAMELIENGLCDAPIQGGHDVQDI